MNMASKAHKRLPILFGLAAFVIADAALASPCAYNGASIDRHFVTTLLALSLGLPLLRSRIDPIKLSKTIAVAALVAFASLAMTDAALASSSSFQPLNTAMSAVLTFMTGSFATTAATVAVAAVGFLALTSRIPWSWCFSVVIGVALIFGAAQIVSSLTAGLGGGGG